MFPSAQIFRSTRLITRRTGLAARAHGGKLVLGSAVFGGLAFLTPVMARTREASSSSTSTALIPVTDKPETKWPEPSTPELILRLCRLLYIFMPVLLLSPLYWIGDESINKWLFAFLRTRIETGGPLFIKFGQWASTRYDLIPLACCDELNLLTQKAPEHSWNETHRILREEFKGDYTRSLHIKPAIVASGSIAQAYEGMLGDRRVAVKVQHPNITNIMAKDLILIENITQTVDAWFKTDYSQLFRQFGENLVDQMDFRLEKSNLEKFSKNFARWRFVKFPQPYTATEKVLIESFEDGHSIVEYIRAKDDETIKDGMVNRAAQQKLASIGLSALLKMIISDNFIHADLHPGNILVRPVHPKNFYEKLRLKIEAKLLGFDIHGDEVLPMCVFLDAGLASVIPQEKNGSVEHFFTSLLAMDGGQLAQSILTLSTQITNSEEAKENFIRAMEERTSPTSPNKWDLTKRGGDCMKDSLELVRQFGIRLDTNIMVPFISTITLEGWQYELDPTVSVLNHVQLQVDRHQYLDHLATKFAHSMWKASQENIGFSEPNPPSMLLMKEMSALKPLNDRYPNPTDVHRM